MDQPARRILKQLPFRPDSTLIGREREKAQLRAQLRAGFGESRLSVMGHGGIGKTALVLEVAWELVDQYTTLADDEWFTAVIWVSAKRSILTPSGIVPLQEVVSTMEQIYEVVARTLEEPADLDATGMPIDYAQAIRTLFNRQEGRVLLILDNLESVTDPRVEGFIREFAPPHKVLVTSRNKFELGLPVRVPVLSEEDMREYIVRESSARGLTIDAQALNELVGWVKGLPLAAWLAIGIGAEYGMGTMRARLGNTRNRLVRYVLSESVRLLQTNHPDSYDMLLALAFFDQERGTTEQLLAQLVDPSMTEHEYKKRLKTLHDHNLISWASYKDQSSHKGQVVRYIMHPFIREYALSRGRLKRKREWHARMRAGWIDVYTRLAREYGGDDRWFWSDQFKPINQEWANFQAVFNWCMIHGEYDALKALWANDGVEPYTNLDCLGWPFRLRVLRWLASEAESRGDWPVAVAARSSMGWTLAQMGNFKPAMAQYRLAWRHRQDAPLDTQCELEANLAEVRLRQGRPDASMRWVCRHRVLLDRLGRSGAVTASRLGRQVINRFYYLGRIHIEQRRFDKARRCFEQVYAIARSPQVEFQRATAYANTWLGYLEALRGDYQAAFIKLTAAERILHLNAEARGEARAWYVQALVDTHHEEVARAGDLDRALRNAQRAYDKYRDLKMLQEQSEVLELIAKVQQLRRAKLSQSSPLGHSPP